MPKQTNEPGSRGNDWKTPEEEALGNAGGRNTDGKFEDVPQGGKRRGPGRWELPEPPED